MYKDFSSWYTYEGFSEGSGTSEQQWIVNPKSNEIGLFKFPKSNETTDHISEKIAADIALLIGLESAKIDLGLYHGREGILSYRINPEGVNLIEGINLLNSTYKNYDSDDLRDMETGECYSLYMIMNSLKEYKIEKDFLKIVIFDFLIGNSDRHDRNWAILREEKKVKLCPVYDNASSLCSYTKEDSLKDFFKDTNRFRALVDSKSRSIIRIDRFNLGRKGPRHSDMMKYVRDNFYNDTIEFILNIKKVLSKDVIYDLVNKYKELLSIDKNKILIMYIEEKLKLLYDIYAI